MSSQCKGISCEALSSACSCVADKAALALKQISSGSCPGMPRHAGRNCSSRWFVSPAVTTMRKCPANASCGQGVLSIASWTKISSARLRAQMLLLPNIFLAMSAVITSTLTCCSCCIWPSIFSANSCKRGFALFQCAEQNCIQR